METFKMQTNSNVKLLVHISSDALAGSNVRLNETIIKKSTSYKFSVDLGNSNDLNNSKVTEFSNFLATGNIDAIIASTTVKCTLKDGTNTETFLCKTLKIDEEYFIALQTIKLVIN